MLQTVNFHPKTQGAKLMISPATDEELYGWLHRVETNGPGFLRAMAEAALLADLKHYSLLRPVLLELKKEWPKPA
jgi:hypothetical protein